MITPLGTLESTAVRPIQPSPSSYGRRGFLVGDPEERETRAQSGAERDQEPNPASREATDATGLSRPQDDLNRLLEQFAREQESTTQERAYATAGRNRHVAAARSSERNDATASLVSGSQSGISDAAAREAGAQTVRNTPENPEARRANLEPGQTALTANGGQGATAEARSAERTFLGAADGSTADSPDSEADTDSGQGKTSGSATSRTSSDPNRQLTEEEKAEVTELKARDKEVRTHEQAHIAASGGLSMGGASFQFEQGPDGKRYAVAGEVQIDTSEGQNPDDTIAKAQRIKAAAMAPAQPSGQDRQVAAKAAQMEAEARTEKTSEGKKEASGSDDGPSGFKLAKAIQAYDRAAGENRPAPWGSGVSFAV